ncbi:MAG: hypothetical protein GXY03_01800 [Solirubrobacterales bacterium]|nr:hypothetical protein [Solirubrobacterales bacterium]
MSELGDSQADGAEVDGELVPADGEQVVEARVLPAVADDPGGVPVVAKRASVPATIAAGAGGLVLGFAAFMLLRVLRRPSAARSVARRRRRIAAKRRDVEVVGSRSFLVDVHLLKR